MRIAVISDTHDRYPPALPGLLRGADELWHLGDVCSPDTLKAFADLGVPMQVVIGNCDSYGGWPAMLNLVREGCRFHLVHIPPPGAPAGIHALLHGHTHVPRDETIGSVRWLNPGCITRPNRGSPPSFAWLNVLKGKMTWEIVPLTK